MLPLRHCDPWCFMRPLSGPSGFSKFVASDQILSPLWVWVQLPKVTKCLCLVCGTQNISRSFCSFISPVTANRQTNEPRNINHQMEERRVAECVDQN